MQTRPLSVVIRNLLADLGPDGGALTDAELLARFLTGRDDDALAVLVRRHARMVWGVCGRLLHKHHDAEDAFQATFLVLVRKAAAIPRQAIANWLYGVARQTAVRLRATAAKRGQRETQVVNMPEPQVRSQASGVRRQEIAEMQAVLDEELGRLPDRYRGVIVLCDLEDMTRKEAARQLGIPEGSVASRLARARMMLAKRLKQRGIALSGGSLAAALSAGSATAAAPAALVSSTIKAASLLAAGRAAGVISAKVAALTEGTVKAMFITKIKSVLAMVLVVAALAGTTGLIYHSQAGEQPMAKAGQRAAEKPNDVGQPPAEPEKPPAQSDLERMLGNWFIMNEDSLRKGEMWVISKDRILMYAKHLGANSHQYFHHVDTGKNPKQIDITVTRVNGPAIGIIKGIYTLDGDELRLCLAAIGKERPAAFPVKPEPGEVLILQRAEHGATPPKAKEKQPAKTDQERMMGGWVIVHNDGVRKRTGEGWLISNDEILMNPTLSGFRILWHYHRLDSTKAPKHIDIDVKKSNGEFIGLIKGIYAFASDTELRLCLGEMGKERPAEFAGKPGQSEFLILHGGDPVAWQQKSAKEEKLRVLIDKVLTAHGGEDRLNKLQFTMSVKHSNGETQHHFVQPPKNYRWETTHPDRTGKRIVILFPNGRRWWTKEPGEAPKEFRPTGAELRIEAQLDRVKFIGPREVLRLKDADHRVALLDEDIKINQRAAVGVQVTGPHFERKMYFDKETHLLLKSGALTFSDYKTFDGIPIAQKENDGHFMPEVIEFRAVERFDAKLFEQP